ncbi:UNKNOWN [Stylonychia lemnae]|uniref:Ion transport domain-containing protein n=1 Tax=Stylonychia lemnae TaxID=5949 RepID=A0A078ACP6_STYLE|nr:UNKNOWN [Stylonychia lemnae]|eukprot:CDW78613.1 UNKNOWN [Stylonychia lemnae]
MGASNTKDLNQSQKIPANQVASMSGSFFQDVDESLLDKDPLLKTMTIRKKVSVLEQIENQKQSSTRSDFEHDLVISFWYAVHQENFEIARHILNQNIYIRQLVTLALFKKNSRLSKSDDKDTDMMKRQIFEARKEFEKSQRDLGPRTPSPFESGSELDESYRNMQDSKSDHQEELVRSSRRGRDRGRNGNQIKSEQRNRNVQDFMNYEGGSEEEDLEQSISLADKEDYDDEDPLDDGNPPNLDLPQEDDGDSDNSETAINKRNQEHLEFLKQQGITEYDIDTVDINSKEKIVKLKNAFRIRFSSLMTNILKILLFRGEEKLACLLTAYYEIAIDDDMIFRAVENMHFYWLQFVWAFNKNVLGPRNTTDATPITYTQLFDIVKNMYETSSQIKEGIKMICQWLLITDDNILLALLYHYQDNLALDYMGYYNKFLDKDLFLYSMNHGNKMFLQHALLMGAFDKTIFKEEEVIGQILVILKYKQAYLKIIIEMGAELISCSIELIQVFEDYVEQSFESNLLLLSYNPLMSIALTSELLKFIADNRKRFENECNKIYDDILELGKMFTSKIDDEKYYENLILDRDFRDRSVLKIITESLFEPLIPEDDPKPENLMIQLWQGKEATRCDGNIYGYSNLMHIIWTKAKKTGGKATFFELISNFFEVNYTVDYTFQYRYRTRSIAFYFRKEFFNAFILLILFQLINYDYLSYFRGPSQYLAQEPDPETGQNVTVLTNIDIGGSIYDFSSVIFQEDNLTDEERYQRIYDNQIKYRRWEYYMLIFSCSLLFSLFLKQFFNLFSRAKIAIDKWTLIDTLNGVLNIASYVIVISSSASSLNNPEFKNNLDYIMIFVLILSWIRFFIYFLVVRDISKMLLTIWEMLADTLSFIFIVVCYFVITASVFTTLYQDLNPDKFGGLAISLRTLYDSAMAVYDYKGMGSQEVSFSIIQIIHIFFANILLMNFLIAILSYTYENMQQISVFKYKVNLYKYCERYLIAFENDSFGEIVLHSPPTNYFVLFILPFMVNRNLMKRVSKIFSYGIFWIENVIFLFIFLLYEIFLIPVVYVKTFINIITCSVGLFTIMFHCAAWFFSGFFFSFFLVFRDIYYLAKILSMHQGCRQALGLADELKEEVIDKEVKLKVYNEIRETVIEVYIDIRKQNKGGEEYDQFLGNLNDLDILQILEKDSGKFEDEIFVVKQSVIHDEWKKRKARQILNKKKSLNGEKESGTKSQQLSRKGTAVSKGLITPKESVASIQKQKKTSMLQDVLGNKKASVSTKIMEAMFQKPKTPDDAGSENDIEEDEDDSDDNRQDSEMDQNKQEEEIVEEYLKKFVIVSESSTLDHINIVIMLKAIPNQIVDYNLEQNELFNFKIFQDSLVAFQNLDMVNAFEYFDEKNRERVQNVKEMLISQRTNLNSVHDIISHVKHKVQKNEEIFAQFNFLENQMSDETVTGGGRSILFNNDSNSNNNFDDNLTADNESRMSAGIFNNTLLKLRGNK